MQTTTGLVLALAAALAVGLVPVQAGQTDVCDEDTFMIPSQKPLLARSLGQGASEVGEVSVSDTGSKDVEVELDSDPDILEFRIFYISAEETCEVASGTSETTCEDPEVLDTTQQAAPISQTCTLEPPEDGTRIYFFEFRNEGSSGLLYRTWIA